jgi:hypothetical protein
LFELQGRDQIGIDLVMLFDHQSDVFVGFLDRDQRPRESTNGPDAAGDPTEQDCSPEQDGQVE